MNKQEFDELNEMEQIDSLFDGVTILVKNVRIIKKQIGELQEALLTARPATGEDVKPGASAADYDPIIAKFPKFSRKAKIATFTKHCETLGGTPSDEQMLKFLKAMPNNAHWERIEHEMKLSHAQSLAWTYLLEKRGWLKYCKVTRNYEKQSFDRPGPVAK